MPNLKVSYEYLTNSISNSILVVRSLSDDLPLKIWFKENLRKIEYDLLKHGAILFRDFVIPSLKDFQDISLILSPNLMNYVNKSTPRSQIQDKVFSSTEYPQDFFIPLHNELSYANSWPQRIMFYCINEASEGGETPTADSRKVYNSLSSSVKKKFLEKGIMYLRNYNDTLGLIWQDAFQTKSKSILEKYCRENNIIYEWTNKDTLKTKTICKASVTHSVTREEAWFNQAHLFSVHSLEEDVKEHLQELYKSEELPKNAFYGDGSSIEAGIIEEIMHTYQKHMITFSWRKSDLLLLDNILFAHGRMPFQGNRKIAVTMGNK